VAEAYSSRIRLWLWTGVLMVLVQVAIGGITRLTDSGLSMTTWDPVSGALPPLTEQAWQEAFDDYRRYPEFYKKNADFTLAEFKTIFWWEWIHRNWARLIGLVFAFPFAWFLWKRAVDEPWVSPYRLTAHLFLALAIFALLYRMVLALPGGAGRSAEGHPRVRAALGVLALLLLAQIAYGGLVAGSDAARHFNTWPTMNGDLVPDGLFHRGLEWDAVRENRLTPYFIVNVQFVHRTLAWLVVAAGIWVFARTRETLRPPLRAAGAFLLLALAVQAALGIATLVTAGPDHIPVGLGVAHQLWAFVLTGAVVRLWWLAGKSPTGA
jgi:cytochrome c oxidase assembly protein subunit 15